MRYRTLILGAALAAMIGAATPLTAEAHGRDGDHRHWGRHHGRRHYVDRHHHHHHGRHFLPSVHFRFDPFPHHDRYYRTAWDYPSRRWRDRDCD